MSDNAPYAPPTTPGEIPTPRTVWPKVVGIIAIVMGSLSGLNAILAAASPLLVDAMSGLPGMTPETVATVKKWAPATIVLSVVLVAAAILLIVGGSKLVARRRSARSLLLIWSGIKIVVTVASVGLQMVVQSEQFAQMAKSGSAGAMPSGLANLSVAFAAVVGVVIGWALPIFVLVWFNRATIKKQVADWR